MIDVETEDGETALHVATFWGRAKIVDLLLVIRSFIKKNANVLFLISILYVLQKLGASMEVYDEDHKTAIEHAINGKHFDIVDIFRHYAYERKLAVKKASAKPITPHKISNRNLLAPPTLSQFNNVPIMQRSACASPLKENPLTPQRKSYNFDSTSPYYVNITHRGKYMQRLHELHTPTNESAVNLFQLTRDRLEELTRKQSEEEVDRETISHQLIEKWRRKVDPITMCARQGQRDFLLLAGSMEDLSAVLSENAPSPVNETNFPTNNSIQDDFTLDTNESDFIRSPSPAGNFVYQMMEKYVHLDSSAGISVFEKKLFRKSIEREKNDK